MLCTVTLEVNIEHIKRNSRGSVRVYIAQRFVERKSASISKLTEAPPIFINMAAKEENLTQKDAMAHISLYAGLMFPVVGLSNYILSS